jgi:N-acetylneuraminic acid mutarotase
METKTWTQLPSGPALAQHDAVAVSGNLYLFGGLVEGEGEVAASNDVWTFSFADNTWEQFATQPGQPRPGMM